MKNGDQEAHILEKKIRSDFRQPRRDDLESLELAREEVEQLKLFHVIFDFIMLFYLRCRGT